MRQPIAGNQVRPKAITAALFQSYPASLIAEVCLCSQQTAYHWKSGIRRPSDRALKLWKLYRDERILTDAFRGFRVRANRLIDDDGQELTPGQFRAYVFVLQLCAEYAQQLGPAAQARYYKALGMAS